MDCPEVGGITYLFTSQHGVMSQKTCILNIAAVRTSYLACSWLSSRFRSEIFLFGWILQWFIGSMWAILWWFDCQLLYCRSCTTLHFFNFLVKLCVCVCLCERERERERKRRAHSPIILFGLSIRCRYLKTTQISTTGQHILVYPSRLVPKAPLDLRHSVPTSVTGATRVYRPGGYSLPW